MTVEQGQGLPTIRLSKILVPVDFSPRSSGAAHYAKLVFYTMPAEVVHFQ